MTRPDCLPRFAYHWTEADDVASIEREGLYATAGGWQAQHADEAGVALTISPGIPGRDWNPQIFHLIHPVRLTVDLDALDAAFGPDLNSLLDDGPYDALVDAGLDPADPAIRTLDHSVRYSDNFRCLAPVPSSAIVAVERFAAPRDWPACEARDEDCAFCAMPVGRIR